MMILFLAFWQLGPADTAVSASNLVHCIIGEFLIDYSPVGSNAAYSTGYVFIPLHPKTVNLKRVLCLKLWFAENNTIPLYIIVLSHLVLLNIFHDNRVCFHNFDHIQITYYPTVCNS